MSLPSVCVLSMIVALGCGESEPGSEPAATAISAAAFCSTASSTSWSTQAFDEQTGVQTGIFSASVELTPSSNHIDAVFGLSRGPADDWSDLAVAIRFNPQGTIDARDGDRYRADVVRTYQAGQTYRLRFDVDIATRTYSAWVAYPLMGAHVLIGRGYAFRTGHENTTSLDHFASFVDARTGPGTAELCFPDSVAERVTGDGCIIHTPEDRFFDVWVADEPVSTRLIADVRVRATAAAMDTVIGVSEGQVDDFNDFAASLRFWTDGTIQVRDGDVYRADVSVPYHRGDEFLFQFEVDVPFKTFTVSVARPEVSPGFVLLASNYRFRPQQLGVTAVRWVSAIVDSPLGRLELCDFSGRAARSGQ